MMGITALAAKLDDKIEVQWGKSDAFVKKQLFSRCARVVLTPLTLISCALDTIYGLGGAIGAICTRGKIKKFVVVAEEYLPISNLLLAIPYANLLKAINPNAGFSPTNESIDGLFSHRVNCKIKSIADNAENLFKSNISLRLTFALLTVACVVARVADGVIAVIAVPLSLATGGIFTKLNDVAWKTIQFPGVIEDLWFCAMQCVTASLPNPSTVA
jgi:hypothetical protein